MALNPTGIYGTDISWTRAVISSLPVVGPVMNFVNLPHNWLPCCFESPAEAMKAEEGRISSEHWQLQAKIVRLGLQPSPTGGQDCRQQINALIAQSKQLKERNIHLIKTTLIYNVCGLIANLLTLALSISLIALGILTHGAFLALFVPACFAIPNAIGIYYRLEELNKPQPPQQAAAPAPAVA